MRLYDEVCFTTGTWKRSLLRAESLTQDELEAGLTNDTTCSSDCRLAGQIAEINE
ncbi:hypothetical protein PC116_g20047 [Phytophthora cactorum]|nr:hypothetical protein PC114_g17021 [Phytophthora cactorum]KAG4231691.1 hypothetical protein PC116_g20047 [Phytophthora cactorum]